MPITTAVLDRELGRDLDLEDPVPAEAVAVIELFAGELAKVAFPDVDAASLRRQADELRSEAAAIARAQQALAASMATLAAHTAALAQTASRAVAYARIYAAAHPEREALATALGSLAPITAPPRTSTLTVGKRRGRPPRQSSELSLTLPEPA